MWSLVVRSAFNLSSRILSSASCRAFGTRMCACVKKKDTVEKGRKEDGHVPPVARDQPNGFRLTPHTLENQSTPSLVVTLCLV